MVEAQIELLGRFGVRLDGRDVAAAAWVRRSSSSLVTLLALVPGRCLHREQVLDALWPDLRPEEARAALCFEGAGRPLDAVRGRAAVPTLAAAVMSGPDGPVP
jgi:hypothetical protein